MEVKFIDLKDIKSKYKNKKYFTLLLFLENGIIKVNNSINYEINQFDLVLLKPDNDYLFFVPENQKMIILDIENYYVYFEDKAIYPLTIYSKNHQNSLLMEKIIQEYEIKSKYFEDAIECYLELLFINLLRQTGNKYENEINLLESIKIFVDKNLKNEIYLEDISKFLKIEKGSLNYFFKKYFNTTPMKYVDEYKLNKAKEIIEQTKNIRKAQEALGYKNLSSFSRWFKNLDGEVPSSYKNK